MILFAPAYDPQTRANLHIAKQLKPNVAAGATTALFDIAADRTALANVLHARQSPLFAMCHGSQRQLLGQAGKPAIDEDDRNLLGAVGTRAVFAYACHTATSLGRAAAEHGSTWWGYTGKLQCPVDTPPFDRLFVELFQLVLNGFWTVSDRLSRASFLTELKRHCELAADAIDAVGDAHPDADTFSAQLCARHIWDRLRIWPAGAAEPEKHPDARPPMLMLD